MKKKITRVHFLRTEINVTSFKNGPQQDQTAGTSAERSVHKRESHRYIERERRLDVDQKTSRTKARERAKPPSHNHPMAAPDLAWAHNAITVLSWEMGGTRI